MHALEKKSLKLNCLSIHPQMLEKERPINPKNLKGNENNKDWSDIIDRKNYRTIERVKKKTPQKCSERIIKIDKHLGQGKKTKKTQIPNIRNEKVIYHRFYKI